MLGRELRRRWKIVIAVAIAIAIAIVIAIAMVVEEADCPSGGDARALPNCNREPLIASRASMPSLIWRRS